MNAPIIALRAKTETELAALARNLIAAEDRLHWYVGQGSPDGDELGRREDRASNMRTAMLDYLLNEHGLTKREVTALGAAL